MSPYQGLDDEIKNNESSVIEFLDVDSKPPLGRSQINLVKTKGFFDLDLLNSRSNTYRMTIHLE